jgi:hypothetical protein
MVFLPLLRWLRSSVGRTSRVALGVLLVSCSSRVGAEPPRLVLQITVDQLRGDVLPRLGDRLEPGGFRRLLDHGANFANANYESANTFTASGHAVLVTGATTAGHGMVANDWFDREQGRSVYCVSDPKFPGLELREVEAALAEAAGALPGVAWAFTRGDLLRGEHFAKGIPDQVQRAFHPQRSGDVVIVQAPFWYMYPEPDTYAAMHGSPYTFVPVIISGAGIRSFTTSAAVSPAQIAPTLAALLRTLPPSGCADTAVLPGILPDDLRSSVGGVRP